MPELAKPDRLKPWYIGAAIIAVTDLITGYLFYQRTCSAPGIMPGFGLVLMAMVYGLLPALYLWLMYLALKSQS